jgi:leader peptidase (prepilin peptidase)/N-methyltransferase
VLAVICALAGLVTGSLLTVVVEQVPTRQALGPPLQALLRHPRGLVQARLAPVLATATAGLFALAALRFGAQAVLPAYLVFMATMVAVAVIDLEHYIVPNRIVIATLVASVPLLALAAVWEGTWSSFGTAVVGALAAGGALLVVNLVAPRGMGMGDVKLAVVLGLFLGWIDLGHVVLGLFLGFLLGGVGGVVLIAVGLRTRRDHVPFAPFLAGGAVVAVLAGEAILDWYL